MPEEVIEPTAKIHFHINDKIGIPNTYSSVEYGISITRDVVDNGLEGIMESAKEIALEVENFAAEERALVLQALQGEASQVNK